MPVKFEIPTSVTTAIVILALACPAVAADLDAKSLEQAYTAEIRTLVERYCNKCHEGDNAEAEIDLTLFKTAADIRKQTKVWQKVGDMLDSGQMPPKKAKAQPSDAEREKLKSWVRGFLTIEARAHAGDPGRVVLRRLSNAEYTYTLRDLTGVESLNPAREFPVDGAAGEGFTNTGGALVMSPALVTKYLDAGKDIAAHAVLLPDGIRFSPSTTPSDWTNERLAQIRNFYRQFTDPTGGDQVNLQGVVFKTNEGGRLPIEKYLAAGLAWRGIDPKAGPLQAALPPTLEAFAQQQGLSPKYLRTLLDALSDPTPSPLLDPIRARWASARLADVPALATEIAQWQRALFKFNSVGHIGKVGGPTRWLDAVSPLATQQPVRLKLPAAASSDEVVLSLIASDAGDGNEHDYVVWSQPRLVAPGRPDVLLRDVRAVSRELAQRRQQLFASTAKYLEAAAEAASATADVDAKQLAGKHSLEAETLKSWLDYLGVGVVGSVKLTGHYTTKIEKSGAYDFIKGWGVDQTPLLIANSSDQHVRVPGNMKPHGIAVHPSPKLRAAVGWQSPVTATMRVEGNVVHAHPECGNGVTWMLELRSGTKRQRIAGGIAQGNNAAKVGPIDKLAIREGDIVSLLIGPRDGNHSCDLTAIDLKLTSDAAGKEARTWDLAKDVSPDVHAGNPHADSFGNRSVWHFYTEPDNDEGKPAPIIPAGSLLAKWHVAPTAQEEAKLASEVQALLTAGPPTAKDSPDAILYKQLVSLEGPMLASILRKAADKPAIPAQPGVPPAPGDLAWGLDPAAFGKHPDGADPASAAIDAGSLCVRAPSVLEIRLPVELTIGAELVTTASLDKRTGGEGSAQAQVILGKAPAGAGLVPASTTVSNGNGAWTANNQSVSFAAPILVNDGSAARKRVEAAFAQFRGLFPAALTYTKIVPVDEVVTLTLYYREDDHLCRLMLDDAQKAKLDKLWDELHYISRDAFTLVDALEQLIQYATQDADPKVFEPLRKPYAERADAFRKRLVDTQPMHLNAVLAFAGGAYRRALTEAEAGDLRGLYAKLRAQEIPHEEAIRLTIARVLVSPAFLYKAEKPAAGAKQGPVAGSELATRLSYFLWSSAPDDELRRAAEAGELADGDKLVAQMRRMLADARTRRLATEFACQWLHVYDFDQLDEKSERHFPTFLAMRGEMYEESIRFFIDLFQNGGTVTGILDADHTFLNESLAKHYGIPGVTGAQWRRVSDVKQYGRGGILGHATTLAKQSGASRTSPILRGNWISEVLLGERLPRPPKDVPQLPDDESAFQGLTVRQITEKHSSDPRCAVCHDRIDAMGFSLEGFDAIGRRRTKDLASRPIDTRVKAMDGAQFEDIDGLRKYLLTTRRDGFVRQFCRKLLGYALGRSIQLSDEPLLAEMQSELKAKNDRIDVAMEMIVRSKQFREIRGRDSAYNDD